MTDAPQFKIEHRLKLEKRNEAGEIYEVVEFAADEQGRITDAKIVERKPGLAPAEAYAPIDAPQAGES